MILRKVILAIVMLIAVMANFTTVEAAESIPYICYDSIGSFVNKINSRLAVINERITYEETGFYLSRVDDKGQYGSQYEHFYKADIGEPLSTPVVILPTSSNVQFWCNRDSSAIYRIEFCFSSDNWNKHSTIFVATLYAPGLPSSTIQEFTGSFDKFITSVTHPTSKTFKLWYPEIGRYIVVKCKVSNYADVMIKIDAKFS